MAADSELPLVAVSACLLGTACRYDGASKPCDWVLSLHERVLWLPFCPEMSAGLGVPRPPIQHMRRAGRWRVETPDGINVKPALDRAAQRIADDFAELGVDAVILKERSPSCGLRQIHADGALADGRGVLTQRLTREKWPLFTEEDEVAFGRWLAELDTAQHKV